MTSSESPFRSTKVLCVSGRPPIHVWVRERMETVTLAQSAEHSLFQYVIPPSSEPVR